MSIFTFPRLVIALLQDILFAIYETNELLTDLIELETSQPSELKINFGPKQEK